MIDRPYAPACSKALALLHEAREILMELVESGLIGEGMPPEATLDYLEDAIGMLTPDEEDGDWGPEGGFRRPPRLTVVGSGR